MRPDFEEYRRKVQQRLVDTMNQTSADFGSAHRIRPDGTSCYDYFQHSDEQILSDIGGRLVGAEQRQEATRALVSRLEGIIIEQGEAEHLHQAVVSHQADWIISGAGFLSKPKSRAESRVVLGLLHKIDSLLPRQKPVETQETVKEPHQQLIMELESRWYSVKKNTMGLYSQEELDNAGDALQFLSEIK